MELKFDLLSIVQELEELPDGSEQFLAELLFFPEFQTFGNAFSAVERAQKRLAQAIVGRLPGDALGDRSLPADVEESALTVSIAPSQRSAAWQTPVELELPILTWHEGGAAKIAYVPALGIEVVASIPQRLPAMVEAHVLFELKRRGLARSLIHLAMIARGQRLVVRRLGWEAEIEPPAERIRADAPKRERLLATVGTPMETEVAAQAYGRDEEVGQLAKLLAGRHPTCVLLVGESGVGKTAITLELARRRAEFGLGGHPFWRTSGSRIVAGQTGFGMWEERCLKLIAEAAETSSIVCIGNLHELMQVGQSVGSADSIASFLRPAMVRGDLLVIAECHPGQLAAIEAGDPRILDPFRRLALDAPTPAIAREILGRINAEVSGGQPPLAAEALRRLDSLHRRYLSYSAFPGRPARFLRGWRAEAPPGELIDSDAVTAAFSRETGLPARMLDEAAAFDHAEVKRWFASRVHAQDPAVTLVVDRLAIIKAQLSRPRQPLASFLFAGPTGVGKTELAKALAEFLYGSKERLLRLDMSEYGTPGAASRLVSSAFDASEGLLTSKVREQPFSVILFDEFEKAHASLFDLLLQVLGEGRLTDAAGRLADFSNSVIIMTSNLGAETFRQSALGFGSAAPGGVRADAGGHFLAAVRDTFRPEFFNRIDRVIPFAPLDQAAVRSIALREIGLAAARDGLAGRRISLHLSDRAVDWLVAVGHDPRYGARPLKRALEQRILVPVAELINRGELSGGEIHVDAAAGAAAPTVSYAGAVATASRNRLLELVLDIDRAAAIRRDYLLLRSSPLAAELESERRRIERQHDSAWRKLRKQRGPIPQPAYIPGNEQRLAQIRELLGRLDAESAAASRFEEQALIDFYARSAAAPPHTGTESDGDGVAERVTPARFRATLLDFCLVVRGGADRLTLTLLSEDSAWMFLLAGSYQKVLASRGAEFSTGVFFRKGAADRSAGEAAGELSAVLVDGGEFGRLAGASDRRVGAIAIQFSGACSSLMLASEDGLHRRLGIEGEEWDCLIETSADPLAQIRRPLADLGRLNSKKLPVRRQFDDAKAQWRDRHLHDSQHDRHRGPGTFSVPLLEQLLEDTLTIRAREALGR